MRSHKFIALLARLVPPRREIIMRADGHVRYVGVGRPAQIGILLAVAAVVGWAGFASARYVTSGLVVAERNVRIAMSDRVIRNMQGEIDDLKAGLEPNVRAREQAVAARDEIAGRNETLRERIAALESDRDRVVQARDDRDRQLIRLNERLVANDADRAELTGQLREADERFAVLHGERAQLTKTIGQANDEIAALQAEITERTRSHAGLQAELETAQRALDAAADVRARQLAERDRLNERVALLSDRLEQFEASQTKSIDLLGESAEHGIETLERTLAIAGLEVPLMLERVLSEDIGALEGVGGPLLVIDEGPGAEAGVKLASVGQSLTRLRGLQSLMRQLPLAAPLDVVRLTSGYGRRRDPFTNQMALHPGLDFASRVKRPAFVTAPGTVAFVGWNGGYGKMVEVDHGLGIRTRFAHLSRIFVKRGQKLEFREKVGLIGSTGRSTSTHLHYEILVDGQQVDPANFLRAGQYVFKN